MTDAPDSLNPVSPEPAPAGSGHLRLRRETGPLAWLRNNWHKRWLRWSAYLVGLALIGIAVIWLVFARNLPDAKMLLNYESPLPTIVRDVNGDPIHSYARERRVQLDYNEFPELLKGAFLSAEDKGFFSHGGLDYTGIVGAVISNLTSDGRSRGASTITQQVAKNLLLTNERSYTRKIKEAILAYRIESYLTKPEILSLYLNEIALGRRSFGVQAAARAYFDKDVGDLELHEMAFLAILPKAPESLGNPKNADRAMERRNWVLSQMQANGYINDGQMRAAQSMPLGIIDTPGEQFKAVGGYYMEEVRRILKDRFGETAEDGPLSVYAGGLWVRTSYDDVMQRAAEKALRNGLLRYDAGHGWSGPVKHIEMDDKWQSRFASSYTGIDYEDWRTAMVLSKSGGSAKIGFVSGKTGTLASGNASIPYRKAGKGTGQSAFQAMKPGDIIVVKPIGKDQFVLRNIPDVSGGMVVQNPYSGRIYAMQGGFDSRLSSFNRATQAMRQPGSTIKPFVYATALDNGMTPASIIVDGPFCVWQSAALGQKCFRNFGGAGGAGPRTMRWGLEQSRNLMTVRTANQVGMPKVVKTFERMKIGSYDPYLSFALGAGETTVEKMTNAYSMMVNHGKELNPRLIDYAQDRNGNVIYPAKWRACEGCNAADWDGKPMPRFLPNGKQLMDPITAYQVVHMLEGVVQRGTATRLNTLGRPMMGKTGTTNGPTNVWFVGGSRDLIAGVYMGFDQQQRSMGGYVQGGSVAVPIAKEFFQVALKDAPVVPFTAAGGVRMVRVERNSGKIVYGAWPGTDPKASVIWEAFKPATEPKRSIRSDEIVERKAAVRPATKRPTTTNPKSQTATPKSNFADEGIY